MHQPRTFRETANAACLTQFNNPFRTQKELTLFLVYNNNLTLLSLVWRQKRNQKSLLYPLTSFHPHPLLMTSSRLKRDLNDIKQAMTHIRGQHVQDSAIAAYQPSSRDPYGRDSGNNEISCLREENCQLKEALREPHS